MEMIMKKGDIVSGRIEYVAFPNKGVMKVGDLECVVKNTLPGQEVKARIQKKRNGKAQAALLEVTGKSPIERKAPCAHFGICGGCTYLNLSYEDELALKKEQVLALLRKADPAVDDWFHGILPSPVEYGYRNKMEFSFGDEIKGGPLSLGMHKRGSFYDIVTVSDCRIVDEDYRKILTAVRDYFAAAGISFYHRLRHEGYLRHLLVRKASHTGEILIDLVTTSQENHDLSKMTEALLKLSLDGEIIGILHTTNDAVADIIRDEGTEILYGRDFFYEQLLGLTFKITPFSFFQTNSYGAEVLYETARTYMRKAGLQLDVPANPDVSQKTDTSGFIGSASDMDKPGTGTSDLEKEGDESSSYAYELKKTPFKSEIDAAKSAASVSVPDSSEHEYNSTTSLYDTVDRMSGSVKDYSGISTEENVVRSSARDRRPVVYDLYCGTGTIAQLMAPAARKVIGVEIVEEAVQAARENAARNGLSNCEFIAGDVLKVIDQVAADHEQPDMIILDPPRDGIHPKALPKILNFGVPAILYISCKPTSLARDLPAFLRAGYQVTDGICVDQFPWTANVETIVLLSL